MTVLSLCMLFGAALSALADLSTDRIPNMLCASLLCSSFALRVLFPAFSVVLAADGGSVSSAGHFPQALAHFPGYYLLPLQAGGSGLLSALGGAAVPLLLYPFFRLHLIGAGDIKLLAALGSFLSPSRSLRFLFLSFLIGSVFSLCTLLRHFLPFGKRGEISHKIHFSVPIFTAVLILTGGDLLCAL